VCVIAPKSNSEGAKDPTRGSAETGKGRPQTWFWDTDLDGMRKPVPRRDAIRSQRERTQGALEKETGHEEG